MSTASPIALDASLWDEPTTGIGLYTRCLAEALGQQGVRVERLGARTSGEAPRGRMGRSAWVLAGLPQVLSRSQARLYHALGNFNLPLQRPPGMACVLTVHDLIPLLLPETVSTAFRWQFRLWLARSVRVAHAVVCVSERTREDLVARFPEAAGKAVVVHHGVDHVLGPRLDSTGEDFLRALALPERYVLYAGSLDRRKNVALVLEALERLHARGLRASLVMVGQSWYGAGPVEARLARMREQGHDLRPLGYQPEPILYELMRRARAFVFPSRYEGFGLPPLEAMRLGTPAVVSTAGSLPEVCGPAPAVGVDDSEGLAQVLERLLGSEQEHRRLAEAGLRHAERFTWAHAARQTLAVYEQALRAV
jgi:glycosyltransferase involved in cell wall biosynthesis